MEEVLEVEVLVVLELVEAVLEVLEDIFGWNVQHTVLIIVLPEHMEEQELQEGLMGTMELLHTSLLRRSNENYYS
jgi:hypothetical protein